MFGHILDRKEIVPPVRQVDMQLRIAGPGENQGAERPAGEQLIVRLLTRCAGIVVGQVERILTALVTAGTAAPDRSRFDAAPLHLGQNALATRLEFLYRKITINHDVASFIG